MRGERGGRNGIEEEWGTEGTRLHPSDNGPIARHTRLEPTDNLRMHYLFPLPSSAVDAFSIIRAFRSLYAFVE